MNPEPPRSQPQTLNPAGAGGLTPAPKYWNKYWKQIIALAVLTIGLTAAAWLSLRPQDVRRRAAEDDRPWRPAQTLEFPVHVIVNLELDPDSNNATVKTAIANTGKPKKRYFPKSRVLEQINPWRLEQIRNNKIISSNSFHFNLQSPAQAYISFGYFLGSDIKIRNTETEFEQNLPLEKITLSLDNKNQADSSSIVSIVPETPKKVTNGTGLVLVILGLKADAEPMVNIIDSSAPFSEFRNEYYLLPYQNGICGSAGCDKLKILEKSSAIAYNAVLILDHNPQPGAKPAYECGDYAYVPIRAGENPNIVSLNYLSSAISCQADRFQIDELRLAIAGANAFIDDDHHEK